MARFRAGDFPTSARGLPAARPRKPSGAASAGHHLAAPPTFAPAGFGRFPPEVVVASRHSQRGRQQRVSWPRAPKGRRWSLTPEAGTEASAPERQRETAKVTRGRRGWSGRRGSPGRLTSRQTPRSCSRFPESGSSLLNLPGTPSPPASFLAEELWLCSPPP